MAMRIYALAHALKLECNDLVDICSKAGVVGKLGPLASINDDECRKILEYLNQVPAEQQVEADVPGDSQRNTNAVLTLEQLYELRHSTRKVSAVEDNRIRGDHEIDESRAENNGDEWDSLELEEGEEDSGDNLGASVRSAIFDGDPFIEEIINDIDESWRFLEQRDSDCNRRSYVKNFFTGVEAIIYRLASRSVDLIRKGNKPDSYKINMSNCLLGKRAVIGENERPYELRSSGNTSALYYFRFVLNTYGKLKRKPVPQRFFEQDGWEAMRKAKKVRNGLTHPKHRNDIRVSDADLATVRESEEWFFVVLQFLE